MASSTSSTQSQSPLEEEGPFFSDFGITTSGGLYAKNNPFQRSGPTDAMERIALANDDLYMRVDLPGVPKEKSFYFLDSNNNNVFFGGLAPKQYQKEHDQEREYGGFHGLRCGCCKVTKLHATFTNGVLRMILSKTESKKNCCPTVPHKLVDPIGIASSHEVKPDYAVKNPFQTKGPIESFGAKKVKEGFYVRVDMPGVPEENVSVGVEDGRVFFSGKSRKESEHEESGRTYLGSFGPIDVDKLGKIKSDVKDGVLRMLIPQKGEE